jgi:hypothetical protein
MSEKKIKKVLKQKPSAYRSMRMGKLGLTEKTPKKTQDLKRWKLEEWVNLGSLLFGDEKPCGQKYKGQKDKTVCRPKKKINKKTPSPLAYDLSEKQIMKAIKQKNEGKRINWKKL